MQSLGGLSVNSQLGLQLQPIHFIELCEYSRAPVTTPHCIYIILAIILALANKKVLAQNAAKKE